MTVAAEGRGAAQDMGVGFSPGVVVCGWGVVGTLGVWSAMVCGDGPGLSRNGGTGCTSAVHQTAPVHPPAANQLFGGATLSARARWLTGPGVAASARPLRRPPRRVLVGERGSAGRS